MSEINDSYKQELEKIVKEQIIFIDTCSLLEPQSVVFWQNVIPLLHTYQKKIIVPMRCIEEVQKHYVNASNASLSKRAEECLKALQKLLKGGLIEVRGEKSDNFADNVFLSVFMKHRMNHKLFLITQDKKLASDIENLNSIKSVKAKPVQVRKIGKDGRLTDFSVKNTSRSNEMNNTQSENISEDEKFKVCKNVTSIKDDRLNISSLPKENDTVYTSHGAIRLTKELGAGGEAVIYSTNTPFVAKIYKKENITRRKQEKIMRMLTKKIDCKGVCYPVDVIYNAQKQFVGFLMPTAKGKELQKSIFIKPLFQKNFPKWKKRDTVELCVTILEKIDYLHDRNIIMGDINPANILVVSTKEVYFVDTDSYQIEDFPCPVGTVNFTAPEIQRRHFSEFLRTMGNENFAVATLLFMIMLPGKPPYSQQGGEDPIANIINMDFSYPFGQKKNGKVPDGPWRFMWSHLTYQLKEAFYTTFKKGEAHSTEKSRLDVKTWLAYFRYYLDLLDNGTMGKQDSMSEELYPTRFKKNPKATYITCKLCKQEVDESRSTNGYCNDCLKKGDEYKCARCSKKIIYTNRQKYVTHSKKHEYCPECFEWRQEVYTSSRCVDCGTRFEITNSEYDYFRQKGLDIPKRCKNCRGNSGKSSRSIPTYNTYSTNNTSGNNNKGGCFITTAVCEYYGLADDCMEMQTMRNYRDNWLINQPDGKELISEYYDNAPQIVEKMKDSPCYSEYCEILWNDYISQCIEMIYNEKYEDCKELYIKMVRYMQSEFSD